MSKISSTICPVSTVKTEETSIRTIATIVFMLTFAAVFFNNIVFSILLVIDFSLRVFSSGRYSPFKLLSSKIVDLTNLPKKSVDAAPKKLAAFIGLIFVTLILILQLLKLKYLTLIVGSVLISCALLEAAWGFCVACHIYTLYVKLFSKNY